MFFIKQTDTRSTQNYSSEPHKNFFLHEITLGIRVLITLHLTTRFSEIKSHVLQFKGKEKSGLSLGAAARGILI